MSGYVVLVDFHLKPGALERFRELVDNNARQSAQMESGCRRFDVIEPDGAADAIILYEIYARSNRLRRTSAIGALCPVRRRKRGTRRQQVGPLRRTCLRGLYLAKPTITRETRTVKEPAD